MPNNKNYDIYARAFGFAVKVANFLETLSKQTVFIEYSRQLIKSSGSIGANISEADGALTKRDFVNKMGIARREAKESRHWLKLIEAIGSFKNEGTKKELSWLINESTEILLNLSTIITNTLKKS